MRRRAGRVPPLQGLLPRLQGAHRKLFRRLAPAGLVALLAATPAAAPDGGSVVRAFEAQRHGVVGCIERYRYHEHGPGRDKTSETNSAFVRVDGNLVFVRAISGGGSEVVAEPYVLPLSGANLAHYRLSTVDSTTIAFSSLPRTADYGDGTMTLDPYGRIERLKFQPSALPARADSGEISLTFGPALPGLWEIEAMHERYTGHVLFLHGWAEIDRSYSNFQRFGSLEEAKNWAQGERP